MRESVTDNGIDRSLAEYYVSRPEYLEAIIKSLFNRTSTSSVSVEVIRNDRPTTPTRMLDKYSKLPTRLASHHHLYAKPFGNSGNSR